MSLCLVGNHSLDTLQDLLVGQFADIENKNLALRDFTQMPLYEDDTLGHFVKIATIKDLRQLCISWP